MSCPQTLRRVSLLLGLLSAYASSFAVTNLLDVHGSASRLGSAFKPNHIRLYTIKKPSNLSSHPSLFEIRGGDDARNAKRVAMSAQGAAERRNIAERALAQYSQWLDSYPLVTKVISSMVISCVGNSLAQYLKAVKTGIHVFSVRDMAQYSLITGLYFAPIIHFWYNVIGNVTGGGILSKLPKLAQVLIMLSIDQTFGAIFVNAGFLGTFGVIERYQNPILRASQTWQQAFTGKIHTSLWPVLVSNWKLWPIVNFINFSYVPLKWRVLFVNFVSIFWNVYLSAVVSA